MSASDPATDPATRAAKTFSACVLAAKAAIDGARVGRYEPPRRIKRAAQSMVGQDEPSARVLAALAASSESPDVAHLATASAVLAVATCRALGAERDALVGVATASLLYDAGRAAIQGPDPTRALGDDELDHVPAATVVASTAMGRLQPGSRLRTAILYEAWALRRAHRLGPPYGGSRPPSILARVVALARAFVEVRASRAGSAPSIVDTLRLFADHASDDAERALVAHLASIASTVAPGAGARAPLEETPPRSGPHAPDPTSPSGITRARVQGAGFRAPPTQRTGTSSNPPPGADAAIKRSAPRGTLEPIPSPPPATVNPIKQSTRRVVMVPRDEDDSPISARTEEVVFARRPATPAPPGPAPAPAGAESPPGSEAPPVDDLLFALEELPAGDPRLAPPSTATEGSPVSVHDRPTAPPPAPEGEVNEHTRPTAPPPPPLAEDAAEGAKPTAPPPTSHESPTAPPPASQDPPESATPRSTEHDDLLAAFLADDPIDGTDGG